MTKIKISGLTYIVPMNLKKKIDFSKETGDHTCFCGFHGRYGQMLEHVRIEHKDLLIRWE